MKHFVSRCDCEMHRIEQTLWIHKIVIWSFVFIVWVNNLYRTQQALIFTIHNLLYFPFCVLHTADSLARNRSHSLSPFLSLSLFLSAVRSYSTFASENFVSPFFCTACAHIFVSNYSNILGSSKLVLPLMRSVVCVCVCAWLKLNGNRSTVVNKRWCNHDGFSSGAWGAAAKHLHSNPTDTQTPNGLHFLSDIPGRKLQNFHLQIKRARALLHLFVSAHIALKFLIHTNGIVSIKIQLISFMSQKVLCANSKWMNCFFFARTFWCLFPLSRGDERFVASSFSLSLPSD